jgi:alpha-D-ribose 1-methylphosphonate 5-triphosphate diphosphatase
MRVRFVGGSAVLPADVLDDCTVTIEDGFILGIGLDARPGEAEVHFEGRRMLPGLIDLHGDAIEKEVEPRPGAFFPFPLALNSIDRRCVAAGITTAFHGISFAHGEIGLRDTAIAAELARALAGNAPHALCDARVHVRYELTDAGSEPVIAALIEEGVASLLSFMDHTPGQGQFKDVAAYKAYFGKVYRRSDAELDAILSEKQAVAAGTLARLERLSHLARQHGIATAGHDDEGADRIELMAKAGASISEFPCNLETARLARACGLATLFGAPNVVRGKSLSGALSARDAIAAGVAACLCSDYAPQAMLPAVGLLVEEHGLNWPDAVRLVSAAPADAAGLSGRGRIEAGKRADLLLVSGSGASLRAESVWCRGREIFSAGGMMWNAAHSPGRRF